MTCNNGITKRIGTLIMAASMLAGCMTGYDYSNKIVSAKKKTGLSAKKISVNVGKKKTIKIKNKNSKCTYIFSSGNKKIASVNKKGVVKGLKKGTAKITVKEKVKKTGKTTKLGVVKVTVTNSKKDSNTGSKESATPTPVFTATIITNNAITANATPSPTSTPFFMSFDFSDNDISKFKAQGDGVKIELSNPGYDDDVCLKAFNRRERNNWFGCGMGIDLSKYLKGGKLYNISCYVMCNSATKMTMKSVNSSGGGFSFPSQVGDSVKVAAGQWSLMKAIYSTPDTISNSLTLYWDADNTSDIYVDSIVIQETAGMDSVFKDTFAEIFGNVGTCNTYSQMRDNKTFTTSLYNSVTMENETKPNTFINGSNFGGSINLSSTLPDGYILPDSYMDSKYPVLNYKDFDDVINTAYEYGFRVRFHVLVWHSQTPDAFFKRNYDSKNSYVSADYMDGRMEYYIRNVINHIYNTPHGEDVVYCIDVCNEYFHNYDQQSKSPWNTVYYPSETSADNRTNKPEYVKKAFQIAYDELKSFGLEDTVKLFYNDYNTYEVTDDIITMINYINEDGKVCAGVGMQSHLDVKYPTVAKIADTIDAFAKEGYEIQITELDVTDYNDSGLQAQYYYDLIHMLVSKKKAGVNITGLTFWGLCDTNSWRRDGKPLLFSTLFSPKDAYYKAIDAAKDAWKK